MNPEETMLVKIHTGQGKGATVTRWSYVHFSPSNSPASTALTRQVRENPSKTSANDWTTQQHEGTHQLLSFFVDAA